VALSGKVDVDHSVTRTVAQSIAVPFTTDDHDHRRAAVAWRASRG
jgi:hypothetical protein